MPEKIGKLLPSKTLVLRVHVGEAKDGESRAYEMTISATSSEPIVRSQKSGRWFVLPWQDILRLAVEAGVDEEEQEGGERLKKKGGKARKRQKPKPMRQRQPKPEPPAQEEAQASPEPGQPKAQS